uniref:Uncharacterized protein n=1 Tax=Solanum lycopersicum TaxID=4081 RepID=K4AUA7_SOLLC
MIEVDFAKCDCCGLTEECTLDYIETIRYLSTLPPDPTIHLIDAMRQLLRRSLESPKSLRSMLCSITRNYIWRPCSSIWGKDF